VDSRNFAAESALQQDMTDETGALMLSHVRTYLESALARAESPARAHSQTSEESALVARARAGEQEAFGTLVRLHQRQVYSLALRMLRNEDDASEATQEVFLSAWQGLHGFREEARFATWLYRIAYNYCLKMAASHRRDAVAKAELLAKADRDHTPDSEMSALHAHNAEEAMRDTVRGEIEHLPPKYRLVLVLRHLQDLSYEEMAEVMRMPIGTVKTQLFRARALLKERLQDLGRMRDEGMTRAGEVRAGLGTGLRGMLDRGHEASHMEDL